MGKVGGTFNSAHCLCNTQRHVSLLEHVVMPLLRRFMMGGLDEEGRSYSSTDAGSAVIPCDVLACSPGVTRPLPVVLKV